MKYVKSYREASKINWNGKDYNDHENIELGCMLRIADATEKIAANHSKLFDENRFLKSELFLKNVQIEELRRSNSALKGHITRLKNKE